MALEGTKKGGPNRRPRPACHCTNRPFFQDIYVKYLMASAFQKKPEIFWGLEMCVFPKEIRINDFTGRFEAAAAP